MAEPAAKLVVDPRPVGKKRPLNLLEAAPYSLQGKVYLGGSGVSRRAGHAERQRGSQQSPAVSAARADPPFRGERNAAHVRLPL